MALCISTYITAPNGIHSQQVVAMAKLKLDHLLCSAEVAQLLLLGVTALLDQVFQQQRVFTHPLDGLQQVGRQVHLVPELQLLILGERHTERIIIMVLLFFLQINFEYGSTYAKVKDVMGRANCGSIMFSGMLFSTCVDVH